MSPSPLVCQPDWTETVTGSMAVSMPAVSGVLGNGLAGGEQGRATGRAGEGRGILCG